jgi:hypothetical protein
MIVGKNDVRILKFKYKMIMQNQIVLENEFEMIFNYINTKSVTNSNKEK